MAVHFKPSSSKAPKADYNDFAQWIETNRYKELIAEKNERAIAAAKTVKK